MRFVMVAPLGSALATLAAGMDRARLAQGDAATRIAAGDLDPAAMVDLAVADRSFEASAVAFAAVAETERTLVDELA
jgi:hypothetical protein